MVGRVIYKNFETGSYEKMRITVYEGLSYADIERSSEFFSCLVSTRGQSVSYDFVSSDKVRVEYLSTMRWIAREAKRYLFANTHVTVAEFVCGVGEISFREFSSKSGVYFPPSLQAAFDAHVSDVYKLCSEGAGDTHTERSIVCELANCAVTAVFGSEDKMFYISGRGIYINAALFAHSREAMDAIGLSREMASIIKTKRRKRHMLSFHPMEYTDQKPEVRLISGTRYALVTAWRTQKARVCRYVYERAAECKTASDTARLIASLPCDSFILSAAESLALECAEAAEVFDYCLKAKSHARCLTVSDLLGLYAGVANPNEISARAGAYSADMKLWNQLPCPPYYDSLGKAYW